MDFPSPLVSTQWLAKHLGKPGLALIDASWRLPGKGDARADYDARHIARAHFFPIDDIADRSSGLPHMLPVPEMFSSAVGAMGVRNDDCVVVYDDQGIFSAPRVWWTFKAMGHRAVSVLDGGLKKWIGENRAVTDARPAIATAAYTAAARPEHVACSADVRAALRNERAIVLDARPAARFRGDEDEPRPGLRRGHMPGAKSLPFPELIAPDGTMKSPTELRAAFERAGMQDGMRAISTCGSGVTASVLDLALEVIGRHDHAIFDASWALWGRLGADTKAYPVETA